MQEDLKITEKNAATANVDDVIANILGGKNKFKGSGTIRLGLHWLSK